MAQKNTQTQTQTIKVPNTFIPPEARQIAAAFRAAAAQVRAQASSLKGVGYTLNSSWEGNSKNNFMGDFSPEPGNVESYASWLEDRARDIEHMKVTVWETKVVK